MIISTVPSGKNLKKQIAEYVQDTRDLVENSISCAAQADQFARIYKISLETDTVLAALSDPQLKPALAPARSIALRLPILVIIGQSSAANGELRRFIELILWSIYFTDHPVEWREFENNSGGFARDQAHPIAFAAHRELNYYFSYAKELMSAERSGLAVKSLQLLDQARKSLNSLVHAGHLAKHKDRNIPFDPVENRDLQSFAKLQLQTFANSCVVLSAYRRSAFDHLEAVARAHFDDLVGTPLRKAIRTGPFGLA